PAVGAATLFCRALAVWRGSSAVARLLGQFSRWLPRRLAGAGARLRGGNGRAALADTPAYLADERRGGAFLSSGTHDRAARIFDAGPDRQPVGTPSGGLDR